MRVDRRVTQPCCDQLLELLGEHVLEHLGLGMDAIPRHLELPGEEQLQQPVMAKHFQRHTPPLLGQPHPVIGLVLDNPDLGQLADHPRHRSGGHPEPRCEIGRRDRRAAASLERVHGLRIILYGRRNKFLDYHAHRNMACLIIDVKSSKPDVADE